MFCRLEVRPITDDDGKRSKMIKERWVALLQVVLGILLGAAILFGIYHAFSKHGVIAGFIAISIPPYAIYNTGEAGINWLSGQPIFPSLVPMVPVKVLLKFKAQSGENCVIFAIPPTLYVRYLKCGNNPSFPVPPPKF